MQSYQEEYIANLRDIAALAARKKPGGSSFEAYQEKLKDNRRLIEQKVERNMELLKVHLFPLLDHLLEADGKEVYGLQEFAGKLFQVGEELDTGLFCQIHQALLNAARLKKDQKGMIRELYWLGLGRHNRCSKLLGLDMSVVENYMSEMRLCFTEAAAYLKYYEKIDDLETRGYMIRSRANMSLGEFSRASEKIQRVKQTLQILQDRYYQEIAPDLPWEKYIFMTHRQMADSISYNRHDVMSPEDIEAIMESVYIVYQTRVLEAAERNDRPPVQAAFSYYSISYYCGLDTLDGLLGKMESLMDSTDVMDFSPENMYGLISLPAFYCQYLRQYPEKIEGREKYIESLYQRILDYVEVFPDAPENEQLFLYLRQLSNHFLETENSISYGGFLLKLLSRFAPDIYMQSYMVARAATALCRIIMEEEPDFFDDIDFIRELKNPEEKKQTVLHYAMKCGLLHDTGKINFINLYFQSGRQWFEEEYEMTCLHTVVGNRCLAQRASTLACASIALGHHSWYDGSHGYPDSYKRLKCPYRQMVDVVGLVDWLENVTEAQCLYTGVKMSFDEAVLKAIDLEGKRFSPLLTARLRDDRIVKELREAFKQGRREACRQLYEYE
ncbi:hypothetical protein [Parablautia intestinalis]|uniref:hypothetical protein n=1 Tax=Parablautia intestinalis TaxID=2320100 RepID=UPI00256F1C99|nr:hypothetical protein [Parablautia intestinalis]